MSDLQKHVMEAIAKRGLKPRPYIYFLSRRSVYWALAVISVLLGGLSVAVAIFAFLDFGSTGGRGFDEMPFDDVAESLPVLWLAFFGLFALSAYVAFSNTRRGYRFRPVLVIALAMALSLILGVLLHVAEAGRRTHEFLAARFPAYEAYTTIPYDEWSRPDLGFLGGEVLAVQDGRSLRLMDFNGVEWTVDISSAIVSFDKPLIEEGDIAIRGQRTGPTSFTAATIDEFD